MMLTIHGLPLACKYSDLKSLIKQECNLSDFILDNLVGDGDSSKKVRIGVADESEGTHLIKCLDGYRMGGNILRILPVAKAPLNQQQGTFDQRGGYPPRNDMPNQPGNYGNQAMPPMGNRPSPWGQNSNQWAPNQPAGSQRSQNNFGYQQQLNQPFQQQQPQLQQQRPDPKQFPQRDMRGRMPQEQPGYGFPQKSGAPEPSRRLLRSVDLVASPRPAPQPLLSQNPPARYTDKPVALNKDFYQGSNQFGPPGGPAGQPGHFSGPGQNQPSQWGQPMQQQKPPPQFGKQQFDDDRKYPQPDKRPVLQKPEQDMRMPYKGYEKPFHGVPHGRPGSPHGRRVSPPGRRGSPSGRRMSPGGGRGSPPGRRVSPPGRRVSPPGRRVSPTGRRVSPPGRRGSPHMARAFQDGRRGSPHARPGSPQGRMPDRRMSPSSRRLSPGRRISPTRRMAGRSPILDGPRKISPDKRFSPSRRLVSPSRREQERRESPSRHAQRFSPSRRPGDKGDKFESRAKLVRPAYEPEATNQAMYSGYRPNLHENVQYPIPGARVADQRTPVWQQERDKAMFAAHMKKQDEERRDTRPNIPPRGPEHRVEPILEAKRSPMHKSRSPSRRDGRERSPLRDRYRRHSPSPRSPRRSWALEKRRSPEMTDAPPPPIWPGGSEEAFSRPGFPERAEKDDSKKHAPWERDRRPFNEPADEVRRDRRPAPEARPFDEPVQGIRIRSDLGPREVIPPRAEPPRGFKPMNERYSPTVDEPTFAPREEYKERNFRRPEPDRKNYPERQEFRDFGRERGEDRDRRREEFPGRGEYRREERKEPFRRDERPDQRKDHDMFQKEFEDIYKRAKEFKQKVEELRRSGDRSRDEYREDHRRDMERGDDRRKMLDDHSRDRRDEARHDYRRSETDRRQDERPRSRHSDEYPKHRELDWKDKQTSKPINSESQAKREKAAEEIAIKILERHGNFSMNPDVRSRILKELRNVVMDIINDMFGYKDVSFIETVIKFNAKHTDRDEYKIFQNVMANYPNLLKAVKRHGEDDSEIPAKTSRRSPEKMKQDVSTAGVSDQQNWDYNVANQQSLISNMMMTQMFMNPVPMMVPNPFGQMEVAPVPTFVPPGVEEPSSEDGFNLYLCKDDFKPFSEIQADYLKNFLVSQLVAVSENSQSQGWAPDITLKGLQSQFRYQVHTYDAISRDWLIGIDFSQFKLFDVLVYTKEELWYERAAVWLPGHSRCRNIEPLDKLKLQNKNLEGADIGKWKLVKKIVAIKGTRIYVDMPPSSARALEKHKMLLSYELQKVSVFLRAVAVDKNAFDAGLKEQSVVDQSQIVAAAQTSPMPSLGHDPNTVKVTLKGTKSLTIVQARKIKESIIYNLFKYHQSGSGSSKTDFVKYGFCSPNCFGVVPENDESKRWLTGLNIGRLNKQPIIILGADEGKLRYFRMTITVPNEFNINAARICERLRQSNQGVKGLNFCLWKPVPTLALERHKALLDVDIDLESVETISAMKFQLDYVDDRHEIAHFKPECSHARLQEMLESYKAELTDSYDVANMDISQSESDDDIIYMGKV